MLDRRNFLNLGTGLVLGVAVGAHRLEAKSTPKQIDWTTLTPDLPPLVDPLSSLTPDQRYTFDEIMLAQGISEVEANRAENAEFLRSTETFKKKLRRSGVDVEKLLNDVKIYDAKLQERGNKMRDSLDGQLIRMAGYLLPLNFSEKGESEFLLVPYVGACVHVPPPPPNQLVYVETKKPLVVKDVFTPVWVSGPMRIEKSRRKLGLADGTAPVSVGYALTTDSVTEYKDKPKRGSAG